MAGVDTQVFAQLGNPLLVGGEDGDGPAVDPSRFDDEGWWNAHPGSWSALPAERLESKETVAAVRDAIAELPPRQREVIVLRDLVGLDGPEVSEALEMGPKLYEDHLHILEFFLGRV